jgi:hypothetical protein
MEAVRWEIGKDVIGGLALQQEEVGQRTSVWELNAARILNRLEEIFVAVLLISSSPYQVTPLCLRVGILGCGIATYLLVAALFKSRTF